MSKIKSKFYQQVYFEVVKIAYGILALSVIYYFHKNVFK